MDHPQPSPVEPDSQEEGDCSQRKRRFSSILEVLASWTEGLVFPYVIPEIN